MSPKNEDENAADAGRRARGEEEGPQFDEEAADEEEEVDLGTCDYLVVGAGAAGLAFVDTLLRESNGNGKDGDDLKVVLVDAHPEGPGGHWNDAYGYVHLHQPSLLYGVQTRQLEGNWLKLLLRDWTLPWKHRASKAEILEHYRELVDDWVAEGKVRYYPGCRYDFSRSLGASKVGGVQHRFESCTGSWGGDEGSSNSNNNNKKKKMSYRVQVKSKVVNGVVGECEVPSRCPLRFPVDVSLTVQTPNQLHDEHRVKQKQESCATAGGGYLGWLLPSSPTATSDGSNQSKNMSNNKKKKYVVLGCGKTGMDTVVHLQREMGVDPSQITWVVPNDVWMMNRDGGGSKGSKGPWSYPEALLECGGDFDAACELLEKDGVLVRLDPDVKPTKFRFPVVGKDELDLLRRVPRGNVVRRGRVTSIGRVGGGGAAAAAAAARVHFGDGADPLVVEDAGRCVFVHCASPGPFNGRECDTVFRSDSAMNLPLLFAPPVPVSMSCLAMLEASRRDGALDLDFGRKMLVESGVVSADAAAADESLTENEVLRRLVVPYGISGKSQESKRNPLLPLVTLSVFFCLLKPDVAHQWLRRNRLSPFSIPGFKGLVYERTCKLAEQYKTYDFTDAEGKMFEIMADRLKPLEGM